MSFTTLQPVVDNPSTLNARLTDAHNDGARVHNNSWGDDGTNAYTTWCQQIDQFSRDREDSLVVFAVTNAYSTVQTPENAKNVLAVAASQDTPDQASHCSGGAGPTLDGRRKPEIYAPGCGTSSSAASSGCAFSLLNGTSMACPVISGAGLLVRQYYVNGFHPRGTATPGDSLVPTGALIKATLINAAVDMTGIDGYPGGPAPDAHWREGWGRLLLDNALYFYGDASRLVAIDVRNAQGLSTGQSERYFVEVTGSTQPLRITLVWTDVPALVNASFAPINNLDLRVTAPDGAVYLGNVFNAVVGESQAGGAFDDRNNVEQVHRLTPLVGTYTIEVIGTAVQQSTQGYALVATGAVVHAPDCNNNDIPDYQDIAGGTSSDCDAHGTPDECEPDCNNNGATDACDIAAGTSDDCDADATPDECEAGTPDCNVNGLPDNLDISSGTSADQNQNGVPDECDSVPVRFVDADASGANNGSSWANAFTDLQSALDAAGASELFCDAAAEIWVARGTYMPDGGRTPFGGVHVLGSGDPAATFHLQNRVALYGGFAGYETSLNQRDHRANVTVLSGDLMDNDVENQFPGGGSYSENAYSVADGSFTDATPLLDGFTITAANGFYGGGMFIDSGSPTVRNCVFQRNSVSTSGGGM